MIGPGRRWERGSKKQLYADNSAHTVAQAKSPAAYLMVSNIDQKMQHLLLTIRLPLSA
jgi:hypothetical protein